MAWTRVRVTQMRSVVMEFGLRRSERSGHIGAQDDRDGGHRVVRRLLPEQAGTLAGRGVKCVRVGEVGSGLERASRMSQLTVTPTSSKFLQPITGLTGCTAPVVIPPIFGHSLRNPL